jgi:hypothetical protein
MSVQLKTRILKTEYWSCGKDCKGHYHNNKKSALQCIVKGKNIPFADICATKLARNKKIITRFIEEQHKARTARSVGVSSGIVGGVIRNAMEICQSNPQGDYAGTRRIKDGRYHNQTQAYIYVTTALSLHEIRALVKIWENTKDDWWIFLDSLSDDWEHRDGPPLYRFSDAEIDAMDMKA